MTDVDYARTITTSASPEEAYEAIARRMSEWWTAHVTGDLTKTGGKLRVDFLPNFGFWTFRADVLNAPNRIEMVCTDASHTPPGESANIEKEWLGTRIIWKIDALGDGSRITLTHHGLTPRLGCYGICLDGWDHFFGSSLKALLDTGHGTPHGQPPG